MTGHDIVARARSAVGKGIKYKNGKGGYDPKAALPGSTVVQLLPPAKYQGCDCSGFVAWVVGVSRDPSRRKDKLWPWWFETSNIWTDARGKQLRFELVPLQQVRAGDLVVYPDCRSADGERHEGHIAVVVDPVQHTVIDCSSSQSRKTGQGITERDGSFFWRNIATVGARWKGGDA